MQLTILVDGAIAGAMVRGDPSVARQAARAARSLIASAGVDMTSATGPDDQPAANPPLHCKR